MAEQTSALESLVGDGKKFKSTEDLAKGKLESDLFISNLEDQNKTLRDELAAAAREADKTSVLEKIMSEINKQSTVKEQPSDGKDNQAATLTQDDIVKLIEAREAAKQEEKNLAQAMGKMKEIFGEKADEALTKISQKLGLGVEDLNRIARTSPTAFLNLVGTKPQDSTTRSMVAGHSKTTEQATGVEATERNKAFYDKLKQEMGVRSFVLDASIQKQLHRDMARLGEAWDG